MAIWYNSAMKKQKPAIEEVLTRQVAEVLPTKEGLASLMQKRTIRLYLGVDPTSSHLHLGHAVLLRKLRQFQELGHEVILLFGTFTAQIGDPSGRDKTREPLSLAQIKNNMATYVKQAALVLDERKIKIKHNGDWLSKMKFKDVLELASRMTVSRLLERDMFKERIKKQEEVWAHELLYTLMQGYDSVAMDIDLEIGGTDQTFNMLVGRKLQEDYRHKEKFVLTVPLLLGTDGRKMSKSFGNAINILDTPNDMYGKIMALRDELIPHYFELCADASASELQSIKAFLAYKANNPMELKVRLAKEIVALYHGEKKAVAAEKEFEKIFKEKQFPSDMPKAKLGSEGPFQLAELLVMVNLASSKSEARRLTEQGGVKINGIVEKDSAKQIAASKGTIVQVGPRRFLEII
ncbi:MAG: tyrosine--tRNA ligase [Candidatus Wildermuthbacteria bacterium]|nr:tyrosine--tRNA ligase [Candidatus Wildermuthbacteria bacterium]